MPLSHILFYFLKNKKTKNKNKKKRNKKCDGSILGKKKRVKVIELLQFESLGEGKVSHSKLWRQKYKSMDTPGGKV
jgi:hypothetical protein